jgi:polysaccharide export outer membrane protein
MVTQSRRPGPLLPFALVLALAAAPMLGAQNAPAPSTPAQPIAKPSAPGSAPAQPAPAPPPSTPPARPTGSAPLDPASALKVKPAAAGEYVIGRGDVLEISVWDNAAVSRTVLVRPDGRISLPLLHDIQAAGLTSMQLREYLEKALSQYIESPAVSVIVSEVHSYQVSVVGQVKTPGRFQLTDHATVLDALAMAGGLTEFADKGRIHVLRRANGGTKSLPFNYDRLMARDGSTGSQDNFYLQGDDIVLVP